MPRKKPEQLKSAGGPGKEAPVAKPAPAASAPTPAPAAPVIQASAPAPVTPPAGGFHAADVNGDGIVDDQEKAMYLEFRRKEFEDADAMRDAQRSMAWFALGGMLLYPFAVVLAVFLDLESAGTILGNMAATYFVSVAAIVAAFFGGQAFTQTKKK
jgi:hypothetical protein